MPPKTYICKICGEEVSKRQSYTYKDGRACKTHPQALDSNENREEQETTRIKEEQKKTKKKETQPFSSIGPKCWLCRCDGVRYQDVLLQMTISLEKVAMKAKAIGEKINFLQMMDRARADAVQGNTVLVTYKVPGNKVKEISKELGNGLGFFVRDLRVALFCHKCAKKFGLRMETPKVNIDQMKNWAIVGELMKPELQRLAKNQIDLEAKTN